jgi:hypothetical protein
MGRCQGRPAGRNRGQTRPPIKGELMSEYRKKPVVIEARQLDLGNLEDLRVWCGGKVRFTYRNGDPVPHIEIGTLEGTMIADLDDWIIQGVKGEFYPCKPDIFEATYEPVETTRS